MYYHFKVYQEDDGYWAECCELQGCDTQGETREELYRACEEALTLYLTEPENSSLTFPPPNTKLDYDAGFIKVAPAQTLIAV